MNKSLQIIAQLTRELQNFENHHASLDYKEFIEFLYHKSIEKEYDTEREHKYGELHFYLTSISRLMKNEFHALVKKHQVSSYEEYSFLAHLQHLGSVRKMELVQMHLMSGTSGFDIIQKLLKNELVLEEEDPDDKRATRVKLSDKGKDELEKINHVVHQFLIDKYKKVENLEETIAGLKSILK